MLLLLWCTRTEAVNYSAGKRFIWHHGMNEKMIHLPVSTTKRIRMFKTCRKYGILESMRRKRMDWTWRRSKRYSKWIKKKKNNELAEFWFSTEKPKKKENESQCNQGPAKPKKNKTVANETIKIYTLFVLYTLHTARIAHNYSDMVYAQNLVDLKNTT